MSSCISFPYDYMEKIKISILPKNFFLPNNG